MPFVLLVLAFLLYAQETWQPPWFAMPAREAALATLGGISAFVVLAGLMSLVIGQSLQAAPYDRYVILKRFAKWRRIHFFASSAFFVASLYVLGWGWAIESLLGDRWTPLIKLIVLAPYLGGLILAWGFYYDVDRGAHAMLWVTNDTRFPSRSAYLILTTRHNLMLMAPPLLLMTAQDFLQYVFPELKSRQEFPYLTLTVLFSLLAVAILSIPWLLKLYLGLTPLPPSHLRDHLDATARRLKFRYTDILVWHTNDTLANAMVTGMLPILRYVILTDRLIAELTTEEIDGVFGHEIGHIKHHHMTLYTAFLFLSMVMLGGLWTLAVDVATAHLGPDWPALVKLFEHQEWFLAVVAIYVFLVFGVLSRHCERQADLFGCNVASRAAFISALEKVADINGMTRDKPGLFTAWQHWTIGQRVEFLRKLDADPGLEARTQRRIGILKWSLTLGLLASIVVLLSANPWNWLKIL